MTGAARDALARAGLSRRDFLTGAGALIVTFSAQGVSRAVGLPPLQGFNPGG